MFEVEHIPECCELVKINKETFNLEVSKLKTIKCLCFYEVFSTLSSSYGELTSFRLEEHHVFLMEELP